MPPKKHMLILWIIEENHNATKSSLIEPGSAEFIYHNAYHILFLNAVITARVLLRYISFHVDNRIIVYTSNTATRPIDRFYSERCAAVVWMKYIAKGIAVVFGGWAEKYLYRIHFCSHRDNMIYIYIYISSISRLYCVHLSPYCEYPNQLDHGPCNDLLLYQTHFISKYAIIKKQWEMDIDVCWAYGRSLFIGIKISYCSLFFYVPFVDYYITAEYGFKCYLYMKYAYLSRRLTICP